MARSGGTFNATIAETAGDRDGVKSFKISTPRVSTSCESINLMFDGNAVFSEPHVSALRSPTYRHPAVQYIADHADAVLRLPGSLLRK